MTGRKSKFNRVKQRTKPQQIAKELPANVAVKNEINFINLFVHLAIFATVTYSLGYNILYVKRKDEEGMFTYKGYGGKLRFLTFINMILQTVYFGLSVINDLVGTNHSPTSPAKRSSLQRFRDFFQATVVFPIGSFVVLTFWGLYAIDRELVFPKELDKFVPSWLNHVMHTTVIIFLLAEKLCVHHRYPRRLTGILCAVGFGLIYQIWILWIALHADIWVYPILQVLAWPARVAFFAACWLLIGLLYLVGEQVTRTVWGRG